MPDIKGTYDCGICTCLPYDERCGIAKDVAFDGRFAWCGYAVVYDDPDAYAAERGYYERGFVSCGRSGFQSWAGSCQQSDSEKNELGII